MKYFKTNTGRIWRFSDFYKNDIMVDCYISKNRNVYYHKKDIIAQADTIEELCDLYIIWLKNRELPLIEKIRKGLKPHLSYFETSQCSFDKGYGAIWTDKGLIYVAKMNEKGELELL